MERQLLLNQLQMTETLKTMTTHITMLCEIVNMMVSVVEDLQKRVQAADEKEG